MLKPIQKGETWEVEVRKVGNLRQANFRNSDVVFQDGDKERLLKDVDKYLKRIREIEGADVKIKRGRGWRNPK